MNKILIGCPVHDSKLYCFEDWIVKVKMIEGDFDIFVADNSKSDKIQKLLLKYDIPYIYVNPENKNHFDIMVESHNAVREYFLKGNYTHLLHLECDVFPPNSILRDLLFHQKEVVSASYTIGEGMRRHILIQMLVDGAFEEQHDIIKVDEYSDIFYMDGSLLNVYACGIGCTLITKKIMQVIKFRCDTSMLVHPDSFFYYDLYLKGIPAYLDTSIICEHRNKRWLTNIIL